MKDCLENYRPVRQRTVRSETTKTLSYFGFRYVFLLQ